MIITVGSGVTSASIHRVLSLFETTPADKESFHIFAISRHVVVVHPTTNARVLSVFRSPASGSIFEISEDIDCAMRSLPGRLFIEKKITGGICPSRRGHCE